MVHVIKANGKKEKFSRNKAIHSCLHAGASRDEARRIVNRVEPKLYEGISTTKMKDLIYDELHKFHEPMAQRYNLRKAIADLDPQSHEFERFITRLMSYHGYKTKWSPRPKPEGFCTDHEIDVMIEKNGKLEFIECKHHYKYHVYTGLDVPMRVWARLKDLQDGFAAGKKGTFDFKQAWVVINTKFSEHAIQYAKCKKMPMLGWKYPAGKGLEYYIENTKAYPLTMLDVPKFTRVKLLEKDIATVIDLLHAEDHLLAGCGLTSRRISELKAMCSDLMGGKTINKPTTRSFEDNLGFKRPKIRKVGS